MSRRQHLSDETIDGLIFEAQLSSNPKLMERKAKWDADVCTFRATTANKSKSEMITDLKAHCPSYIVDLLNADTEAGIRERYVYTFIHEWRKTRS